MDEEIELINKKTTKQKLKNFFINNKKNIIILFSILFSVIIFYFLFLEIRERNQIKLAEKYNKITIKYLANKNIDIKKELVEIVNENNTTYSPLALYFLIDNEILKKKDEINNLFDQIINEAKLEKEIKNLNIYKKGLFNSDFVNGEELIKILSPIINSDSIWKPHSHYLLAEFFYSKNEKDKSKKYLIEIINSEESNQMIKSEAQKKLNRDFSE